MNPNPWLEKAERLRSTIAEGRNARSAQNEHAKDDPENLERVAIAHWLQEEFSDEPPEDTETLPLFITSHL